MFYQKYQVVITFCKTLFNNDDSNNKVFKMFCFRRLIKKSVNACDKDVVIFAGSGATAAVHKVIHALKLHQNAANTVRGKLSCTFYSIFIDIYAFFLRCRGMSYSGFLAIIILFHWLGYNGRPI